MPASGSPTSARGRASQYFIPSKDRGEEHVLVAVPAYRKNWYPWVVASACAIDRPSLLDELTEEDSFSIFSLVGL